MGNVPNIVLTRVDNRLIHGQVATNWLKTYNANLCIVADDAVAEDSMQQTLLKLAAGNMQIRFFTIQKTIDIIYKASPSQKIAIICRTPIQVAKLVAGNVPITTVNIGNMHDDEGKKKLQRTVYADAEEIAAMKELIDKGVTVEYRMLPKDHSINMAALL
ncbi:PTS system fructose-specific EIIB component [Muribaculaceae bacterium]|nr:PTS sugar transporter subunit IIB [Lachnospiraceae bacterium]GFI02328.1 PTS system fructose-specific EIIB component [Lachnospiraceae bacterium]GFI58597.1 PTS system fructose-specific EIIB component [Muribaculaceae bacterium]